MDLLASHHRNGRRFAPLDFIEKGNRIAARLAVTDPGWSGAGESFKVFTLRDDEPDAPVVLFQDTTGKENALALLSP